MSAFQDSEVQLVVGPRGELQGRCEDCDEAGYGKLRKILITHGKAINSVQMGYEHNNLTTLAYSHRRGGDGDIFDSVILKPWETFRVISGHYGTVDGSGKIVVRSLRFVTNETTYGPFGREEGTPFCFSFQPGFSFSGFHGRSGGGYLRAIGVYVSTGCDKHIEPEPDRRRTTPYHRSVDKSTNYKVARIYYT